MITTHRIDLVADRLMLNPTQNGFLQAWLDSPVLDKRLTLLLDKTIIFLPPEDCYMSDDVFTGKDSLARQGLGENWREDLETLANSDLIPELYQRCYESQEPLMDYVTVTNSRGMRFSYERLLLPFKIANGTPMLVNFSELTNFCSGVDATSNCDSYDCPTFLPHTGSLFGWEEHQN